MIDIRAFNKRLEALRRERSTFLPYYRELSDYLLAHRGRFLTSDRNKGYKRNTRQINNTGRLAVRTLASGMIAGITSPARPWFRLGSGDKELDEVTVVKEWLFAVEIIMYKVFAVSNFYNSLHQLYGELGTFGTAAMGIYQDFKHVIWCQPYTVGSYMLGLNGMNRTDTLYREYELSVGQLVKQFGIANVSPSVREQWKRGNTENWIQLVHAIEPNDDRDMTSVQASDMPWRSAYYETSVGNKGQGEQQYLRYSGFEEFPIVAPRWDVTGEDVYATDCPGMTALGDTKALQLAERRKYQAIDKMVNPPLQADPSLKSKMKGNALGASEVVYTNDPNSKGIRSIYEGYRPEIEQIKEEIILVEGRVKRAFYEDLFLMMANDNRSDITATEIAERHQEKLLMLGPMLERLNTELLNPSINRTFNILQRAGVLPEPPAELENKELSVEYISILAQAQRMVNTSGINELSNYVAQVSQVWPEARFKVNINQGVDDYADALGVNPSMVYSDDEAAQRQQAEAKMQQQMAAAEQAQQMANTAKTASQTPMPGGGSALDRMLEGAGLS